LPNFFNGAYFLQHPFLEFTMAVNIKNERVERLLDEVAALTGESKTEAIRRSLEERRDRLARFAADAHPADRLRRVLEREIWPTIPASQAGRRLTKAEEEAILGYGPDGT
jgi:antitoxin VapB